MGFGVRVLGSVLRFRSWVEHAGFVGLPQCKVASARLAEYSQADRERTADALLLVDLPPPPATSGVTRRPP